MKKPASLILILLFASLFSACSLQTGFGAPSSLPFEDDFSLRSSGWDQMDETLFSSNYYEGYYRIQINQANYMAWANPGLSLGDVHIEVEATFLGGGLDNHFGVICRAVDVNNFYALMISADGFYGIAKRVNGGSLELIGTSQLEYSDAILQGVITNQLAADCAGQTLRLSVNGQTLLETTDSSFTSGDVGLLAGTFNIDSTEVVFDNFLVTQP